MMDQLQVAEWSRYVVIVAVLVYLGSWVAFCAESGIRSRLRRQRSEARAVPVAAPAMAGATASLRPSSDVGDEPDALGSPADTTDSRDEEAEADRMGRLGRVTFIVGAVILAAGVVMRSVGTGRVPWGNMYEFSITGALVASVALIVLWRFPAVRQASVWSGLLIFLLLGMAVTVLYVAPGPIATVLRSYWLVVHVGAAVTAFGLFTVGAALSVLQIAAERAERRNATTGIAVALPDSRGLDRLAYRLTAIAFPIWTIGPLILGAVWAEASWGRYWGWDPKEVWALITWLAYAAYLHARATAGWKGSKASAVALLGFATLVFSYFGVNIFINGNHSYSGL